MTDTKPHNPAPDAVRLARHAAGLTQTEAAKIVSASMRAWQQWESGERAMPPGLFELFMLKTRQWSLNDKRKTE
ncbi:MULTISPECIES: helix-turn-helix domain-containing protein [Pseudomonadaceae]|jgi:DNA-binding transcriptional regulator YiaG|uniref:helix-turn-helix domain-containing protein n=1 Tax=Pseudomonadaceae TaxID=135621 RepID=UPI00053D5190|nr:MULTISPECIES: helix-turn-helix domain-containing protein [Pseudomonas]